ncbi:hypothetical protein [Paraburkholderia unamae]|uniref:Uncharacterized protein n=1 Tax=Paraburkholderia unamae TaxID=219649 RepID=A0ACC6RIW7_9BURK
MAHALNKRMQKDVTARIFSATSTGEYTWPEVVMGAAEFIGNVIGSNVENQIQAQEMVSYVQRFVVQALHTAGVAKEKGSGLILPE